jgi:hypothetical protein
VKNELTIASGAWTLYEMISPFIVPISKRPYQRDMKNVIAKMCDRSSEKSEREKQRV